MFFSNILSSRVCVHATHFDLTSASVSKWVRYDETNCPILPHKFLGEDPYTGDVYFSGTMPGSNDIEIYFLDRGPTCTTAQMRTCPPAKPVSFAAVRCGGRSIAVNYSIPRLSRVNLSVYSLGGKRVGTLFDGVQEKGSHRQVVTFNPTPGVYLVKLSSAGCVQACKVIVK